MPCVSSGLCRERTGEGDERAYADPGPTRTDIPVRLSVQECGSGNVEMCPWGAFCYELPKEGGGHQSAGPTVVPSRAEVGDLGVQSVADLLWNRKLPDVLASRLGSIQNQVGGRVVGGHQTSRPVAEGDLVLLCGFGSGLTVGTALWRWGTPITAGDPTT